jgi:hypothetical protein
MPHAEQNVELRTIVLLFLTMFVSGTETMIVNPVLPHFGRLPVIVAGNLSVLAVTLAVSSAPSIEHWIETFFFPDSTFVTASLLFALFFILQSASAARSSAIETMAVEAVEDSAASFLEGRFYGYA